MEYRLNASFAAPVERKSDGRSVVLKFKKGDQYSYLAYGAEGSFLIRFRDTIYIAGQDLAEHSIGVGEPADSNEDTYDEWLKLKCANGAVGWILVGDVQNSPGFTTLNITEYGSASDQSQSTDSKEVRNVDQTHIAASDADECGSASSQMEMNVCYDHVRQEADDELTQTYRTLMTKISDQVVKSKLRDAERAWISYRDKECEFETYNDSAGSIYPTAVSICLTEKIRAHNKELLHELKNWQ